MFLLVTKKNGVTIEDLPGVGPATAEKLRAGGYSDMMSLAVASPQMLVEVAPFECFSIRRMRREALAMQ